MQAAGDEEVLACIAKISEVEEQIRECEASIEKAAEKVEEMAATGDGKRMDYWMEEKKQLREKEKQLREEKKQLLENGLQPQVDVLPRVALLPQAPTSCPPLPSSPPLLGALTSAESARLPLCSCGPCDCATSLHSLMRLVESTIRTHPPPRTSLATSSPCSMPAFLPSRI